MSAKTTLTVLDLHNVLNVIDSQLSIINQTEARRARLNDLQDKICCVLDEYEVKLK